MKTYTTCFIGLIILYAFIMSCTQEPTNQIPTCKITSPANGETIKKGETVTISVDADDADGNIKEVIFYTDGNQFASSISYPYHRVWDTSDEEIANHTLKIVAFDNTGASSSDEITIEITGVAPVVDFYADKEIIEAGETVSFTDQSTNSPSSWLWDFGDGNTSNEQNPTHLYSSNGRYTVTLTASNEYGDGTEVKNQYIALNSDRLIDIDNNTYRTVTIGSQVWMAENLKATHYPDGKEIQLVTEDDAWSDLVDTAEAYCYYNNSFDNIDTYGLLYTYTAAKNSCPYGWHLPTNEDWYNLEKFIGMSPNEVIELNWRGTDEGTKIKATSGWRDEGNGTDEFGFTALPGGYRTISGWCGSIGKSGNWWSGTENNKGRAYFRSLDADKTSIYCYADQKKNGYSVRCIRD